MYLGNNSSSNNERFQVLLESINIAVILVDSDMNILTVNSSACNLFQFSKDELDQANLKQLISSTDFKHFQKQFQTLNNNPSTPFSLDIQIVNKQTTNITVAPIYNTNNEFIEAFVLFNNQLAKTSNAEKKNQSKSSELDAAQRELTAQTMTINQKNIFLKEVAKFLDTLDSSVDDEAKEHINKLKKMLQSNIESTSDWANFKTYFTSVHPDFFDKLSRLHPELSQNELRHCAYIKMKLSNRDVSELLYVMPRTVEIARYRIKKKMKLAKDMKLKTYINNI